MEESLKTSRVIHTSLMALSAAAFVFAISMRYETSFDGAHKNLESITVVDPSAIADSSPFPQDLLDSGNVNAVISAVEEQAKLKFDRYQFAYRELKPAWFRGPRFYSTLEDLQADLRENKVSHAAINPTKLIDGLVKAIRGSAILTGRIESAPDGATVHLFAIELRMKRPDSAVVDVQATILPHHNLAAAVPTQTFDFTIPVESTRAEFPKLRDWFTKTTDIELQLKGKSIFPGLEQFWGEVAKSKPLQAYGAISAQRERGKKDISVLGLTFAQDLAILAVPLALFGLVLYLSIHVSHLLRVVSRSDKDRESLHSFPWIALFGDRTAIILGDASVILLPLIANSVLIWKSRASGSYTVSAAIALACASLVVGVFCRQAIEKLRSLKHKQIKDFVIGA